MPAGTTPFRSRPICLPWSPAAGLHRGPLHHRSGREVVAADLCRGAQPRQMRACHAFAQKAMRWDEETFGLEYDLDVYMIVAVDDFNMGAMENKGLNVFNSKYVLASPETATDADYQAIEEVIGHEYFHNWTGNRVTCRDWFQLSPQGRADGLPRPGVLRRHDSAGRSSASMMCACCATASFPRMPGRWPIRCGPRPTSRSTISTPPRSTTRAPRSSACTRPCSARRLPPGAAALPATARWPGGDHRRFSRGHGRGQRRRSRPVPALVQPGRHPAATRRRASTMRRPAVLTLTMRQSCPPTPGQERKEPFLIPLASACSMRTGTTCRCAWPGKPPDRAQPGCCELRTAEETLPFRRPAGAPRSFAAARLFGAGAARIRPDGSTIWPSSSPTTATRSTAGKPGSGWRPRCCWPCSTTGGPGGLSASIRSFCSLSPGSDRSKRRSRPAGPGADPAHRNVAGGTAGNDRAGRSALGARKRPPAVGERAAWRISVGHGRGIPRPERTASIRRRSAGAA